ncbi:MAG: sugar phosphate isomerase/epimerase family protein [Sphaerochaetaceae bacterium]
MNTIGFCTGFATTPRWQIDESLVREVKMSGYDYIEFPLMSISELDGPGFGKLRELLEDLSLPSPFMCNLFPAEIRFLKGFSGYDSIRTYLRQAFERCNNLGTHTVVFGSAKARDKNELSRQEAEEIFIRTVTEVLLPECERFGITVLLEPLHYNECDFINTVEEAAEIVTRVNSSRFSLMADLSHMYNNGEDISTLHRYLPMIEHIHISNKDRRLPEQRLDPYILQGMKILVEEEYTKAISLETEYGDIVQALLTLRNELESSS